MPSKTMAPHDAPAPRPRSAAGRPRWPLALLWLVVLASQSLGFFDLRHDDAYISYRYGRNLAAGHGLVFEPGDPLLGTTAPGHAVVAAGVALVTGKNGLPTVMSLLGCLGWTLQAVVLARLLRPTLGLASSTGVALAVAVGIAHAARWVALETHLAFAAALGAVLWATRDRWVGAAGWCAPAGWLRPDAYLVAASLAPWGLVRAWTGSRGDRQVLTRRLALPVLAFALPTAAWILTAELAYGSPIPRSALVKQHAAGVADYAEHLFTQPGRTVFGDGAGRAASALIWLLAIGGSVRAVRHDRRLAILPVYALAHLLAYLVLRPPPDHTWHLHPAITLVSVLALVGLVPSTNARPAFRTAGLAVLAVIVMTTALRTGRFAFEHPDAYWFGARDRAYREAADYIVRHGDTGDLISGFEIGTLGYWSEREIYDWAGLVTRQPQFPSGRANERWFVVDDGSRHVPEGQGWPEVATFTHGGFTAHVFDTGPVP